MNRREFLGGLVATGAMTGRTSGGGDTRTPGGGRIVRDWMSPEVGKPCPAWTEGELALHFLYFGTGEAMFYQLPDGTTWVNDCGDFVRPHETKFIPRRPSDERLGAEWMARYIARRTALTHLDYLTVTHWHFDHVGDPALAKRFPSGRIVSGVAALGESFTFGHYLDFEYPRTNVFGTADVPGLEMTRAFVRRAMAENGMTAEGFRPGALNQIRLQHDPDGRYAGLFEIRNLAANGVAWTGQAEDSFDGTAAFLRAARQDKIMQNTLSSSFRLRYGRFSFYCGGDTNGRLADETCAIIDYEARVARLAGPVTVAKTNHHSCRGSMGRETVSALRAQAYVNNVWCPRQVVDETMKNMSSRDLYEGDRFVFNTFLPDEPREKWTVADWWKDVAPAGHVVVKVAPGGGAYRIYVIRNVDEEDIVTAVYSGVA